MRKILPIMFATVATVFSLGLTQPAYANNEIQDAEKGECTSLLPDDWCYEEGTEEGTKSVEDSSNGIMEILRWVAGIMTMGVGVIGTIGIIWCGFLVLTAKDNESQVAAAKKRLLEIVIGMIVFGLAGVLINLFLPGGDLAGLLK